MTSRRSHRRGRRIDAARRRARRGRRAAHRAAQEGDQTPSEAILPPPPTHWIARRPGRARRRSGDRRHAEESRRPIRRAWLHFGGNYASWRHSPIKALTPASLKNLRVAWMLQTGVPVQLEVSPIVYDGILYATSSHNRLFALDAVTGKLLWRYDHQHAEGPAHLLRPGQPRPGHRRRQRADGDARRATDRVRSQVRKDRVEHRDRSLRPAACRRPRRRWWWATSRSIGVGGGEYGVRGFFDAYDAKTGERRWRHFTVPVAGEPGVETWAGDSWKSGGARHLGERLLRPRHRHPVLGDRQPEPGLERRPARGRQPLQRLGARGRPQDRQAQVALPVHAARRVGLRRQQRALPGRRRSRRSEGAGGGAGEPQRLLLSARSPRREVPARQAVRRSGQLGDRHRRQGPPAGRSQDDAGRRGRDAAARLSRASPAARTARTTARSIPTSGSPSCR